VTQHDFIAAARLGTNSRAVSSPSVWVFPARVAAEESPKTLANDRAVIGD
jgi:hypothetical protein